MRVLITSGGTRVPIDPVRYINNMSTGRFGSEIATQFLSKQHQVHFFHANRSESPLKITTDFYNQKNYAIDFYEKYKFYQNVSNRYSESNFKTYEDYSSGIINAIDAFSPHIIILAAAVSDFIVNCENDKISSKESKKLDLIPTPKVISKIKNNYPGVLVVGFKLVYDKTKSELHDIMVKNIKDNCCDLLIGNDLVDIRNDEHNISILSRATGYMSEFYSDLSYAVYSSTVSEFKSYF